MMLEKINAVLSWIMTMLEPNCGNVEVAMITCEGLAHSIAVVKVSSYVT